MLNQVRREGDELRAAGRPREAVSVRQLFLFLREKLGYTDMTEAGLRVHFDRGHHKTGYRRGA